MIDQALAQALQKEIPVLTAQIRSLYAEFDKKFHLKSHSMSSLYGKSSKCLYYSMEVHR